jgi:hypothetical protein
MVFRFMLHWVNYPVCAGFTFLGVGIDERYRGLPKSTVHKHYLIIDDHCQGRSTEVTPYLLSRARYWTSKWVEGLGDS